MLLLPAMSFNATGPVADEGAASERLGVYGGDLGIYGGQFGSFENLGGLEALVEAPTTTVVRWADIFERDGVTPWMLQAPLIPQGSSVTITQDDETRRKGTFVFKNDDGALSSYAGGFWYDKIIKVYRGAQLNDELVCVVPLGEFMPDLFTEPHFPNTVTVNCRDYSKALLLSKFSSATTFVLDPDAPMQLEDLIEVIATNGGITKLLLPVTGVTLDQDFPFDKDTTRWDAIVEICTVYNYEVYFDALGYLTMRPFRDPSTSPVSYKLSTGLAGNLVTYSRDNSDTRIFNVVNVSGENASQLPVWAQATNTNDDSPTSINRLGERSTEFESSFLQTDEQCQALADSLIKVSGLETYEMKYDSLVLPWLDVGEILNIETPDATPGAPTRFLLTDLNIPLALEASSGTGRRVTLVA